MKRPVALLLCALFLTAPLAACHSAASAPPETPAASASADNPQPTATPDAAAPLTAGQLRWVVEPGYDYQQVVPLRGSSFSDIPGPYSNGTTPVNTDFYEMSFPGYSNLPQYYQVQGQDGGWRLYYMPYHTDSGDIPMDAPGGATVPRYDAGGIVNYAEADAGYLPCYSGPWHLFTWLERGSGSNAVYYDTCTGQGILVGDLYSLNLQPVAQAGLHKPYPAGRIDTGDTGIDASQPFYQSIDGDTTLIDRFRQNAIEKAQEFPKGYIGTDGQPITDFVYERAEDFSEGIAACMQNGKWGYIDDQGNPVTEFVYDGVWEYAGPFDSTVGEYGDYPTEYAAYPCTSDTMVVYRDGKAGLLYRDGTLLIAFGELEDMAPAYNDELWAKQGGKWGLVDLAAAKKLAGLDPALTAPAPIPVPDPPYENYALEQIGDNGDRKPDFPQTRSELGQMLQGGRNTVPTLADTPFYAKPEPGIQAKGTFPAGSQVQLLGILQFIPGWYYVSSYDQQQGLQVGWVNASDLDWDQQKRRASGLLSAP